jgi:hypothetical protein
MSILTEEEILKITQAAIEGSGGTLAEDKIIGTVQWAKLVRTQAGLLQDILAGRVLVDVTGAEPVFKPIMPGLTKGKASDLLAAVIGDS